MGGSLTWRRAALALLPVAAAVLVTLAVSVADDGRSQGAPAPPAAIASHPSLFFDEATFFKAVRAAESAPQPEGPVYGGIIPHHWLPGHLITGFFRGPGRWRSGADSRPHRAEPRQRRQCPRPHQRPTLGHPLRRHRAGPGGDQRPRRQRAGSG